MISPILFGSTENLELPKNPSSEANAELKAEDFASFFNLSMFAPPLQNAVKITENQTSSENEVASQSPANGILTVTNVQITVNSLQIQDLSFQNATQKPLLKSEFPLFEMKPEPNLVAVNTPLQTQESNLQTTLTDNLAENKNQTPNVVNEQIAADLLPKVSSEISEIANFNRSDNLISIDLPIENLPLEPAINQTSDSVNSSVFQVDNGDLLLEDNTGLVPENGNVQINQNPSNQGNTAIQGQPIYANPVTLPPRGTVHGNATGQIQVNPPRGTIHGNATGQIQVNPPRGTIHGNATGQIQVNPPRGTHNGNASGQIRVGDSENTSLNDFILKKTPPKVEVVDTRKIRERIGLPKILPEIKPIDTSIQEKVQNPKIENQEKIFAENSYVIGNGKDKTNVENNSKENLTNFSTSNSDKNVETTKLNVATQNQQSFSENSAENPNKTNDLEVSDKSFGEKLDSFPNTAVKVEKNSEADVQIKGLTTKVFEQIEPKIAEMIGSIRDRHDRKTLKLKLHPEELGKVEITLERNSDGKMNAHFQIESEKTHQILSESFNQLRNSLENSGQQVGKIEISYNSFSSNGNESRQNHSQQSAKTESQFNAKNNFDDNSNLQNEEENRLVNLRA